MVVCLLSLFTSIASFLIETFIREQTYSAGEACFLLFLKIYAQVPLVSQYLLLSNFYILVTKFVFHSLLLSLGLVFNTISFCYIY